MTIEEKIKDYILTNYKSVRDFVTNTDLPYSTVDGILKRGIANSSIGNVLKICQALGISADELANNRIVPIDKRVQSHSHMTEINDILSFIRRNINDYDDLTLDSKPMNQTELEMLFDGIEITIGIIKRNRERNIQQC